MPKNVLADYFRELKAFQLAFWYKHAAQIRAVISREWLEEAEADAAAEGWEELAIPDCGTRFFTRTVNGE